MPQIYKYKCMNDGCTSLKGYTGLFRALNNSPECPVCRGQKVEEWQPDEGRLGPIMTTHASFGAPGAGGRIDARLDALANAHGLSDISNTDGRAAKYKSTPETGKYGNFQVGGISCPINDKITTVSGASSAAPIKASPSSKLNTSAGTALRGHTQVVAEHRG